MKGTVKLYSLVRGSGIITGDDGKEYQVKMSGIKGVGMKRLSEGQKVTFEFEGLKAIDVEES